MPVTALTGTASGPGTVTQAGSAAAATVPVTRTPRASGRGVRVTVPGLPKSKGRPGVPVKKAEILSALHARLPVGR